MAEQGRDKELVGELVTLDAADGRGPGRGLLYCTSQSLQTTVMYREEEDRGGLESSRGVSLLPVKQEVSYLSAC